MGNICITYVSGTRYLIPRSGVEARFKAVTTSSEEKASFWDPVWFVAF